MNTAQPQTQSNNSLGTAPVSGLIRKYAIPAIIGMLVSAAYNITDQIFIGQVVGMLGNAATNIAFPTVTLATALSQLIGVGTAANFNLNMGAKKPEEASRFIGTGLMLLTVMGPALMALVLMFKTPILLLCGATQNTLPFAQSYLEITAIGLPFLFFTLAASQFIRADGSPVYAMISTVTGAILNVFLDWWFMYGFGWGIQGAAAATTIGQIVSFIVCVAYFPRFKTCKIKLNMLRVKMKDFIAIAKLGMSNFTNLTIMMLVNIVMNNQLSHYGAASIYGSDIPLAVSGVVAKVNSVMIAFCVGLAHGCQPIHSFNMGAKNYARIKETYKKSVTFSLCVCFVVFVLFQLFPRQIVSIFGSGDDLYFEFADRYMRVFMFMVVIFGIQPISGNYFTSIGDAKRGVLLSLSRQGFFLIPLLIVLPMFYGLDGVLFSGPISDFLSCIWSVSMVTMSFKRLTKLQNDAAMGEPSLTTHRA